MALLAHTVQQQNNHHIATKAIARWLQTQQQQGTTAWLTVVLFHASGSHPEFIEPQLHT